MSESFFRSFLAGEHESQALLPASFRDRQARIAHVRRAAARSCQPRLCEIIVEQNRGLPTSPARERHLEAIARPGTAVVVTGQQLGLFLGPLYTFYKAATAIAAARQLENESGVRCVPLFWLQTEDHDFPEINHCHVLLADGTRRTLALPDRLGPGSERVSVKHRVLGEECQSLATELEACLQGLPFAGQVMAAVRADYCSGHTLVRAFAGFLSEFFAEDGLLVFDPRAAPVEQIVAPIYRRALVDSAGIAQALLDRIAAMQRSGFETQVHVRPGSPLFFFHPRRPDGPRYRLEAAGEAWTLVGSEESISSEALVEILAEEPIRFSSSALLRPLAQDYLLPTAAYVGGPSEVSYFAQLPPVYQLLGIPMPLIVPRARFRCLEPKTRALLGRLHLRPEDVEQPQDALRRKLAPTSIADYPAPDVVRDDLMNGFCARLDELGEIATAVDPHLEKAVQRTRATVARATARFSARYGRALLEKDRILLERIERLQNFLFPGGVPQERWDSLPYFAAKYGPAFKARVFAALDPFAGEIRNIEL